MSSASLYNRARHQGKGEPYDVRCTLLEARPDCIGVFDEREAVEILRMIKDRNPDFYEKLTLRIPPKYRHIVNIANGT